MGKPSEEIGAGLHDAIYNDARLLLWVMSLTNVSAKPFERIRVLHWHQAAFLILLTVAIIDQPSSRLRAAM